MTRRPHSRFHDAAVALIAATTLIWGYLIGVWTTEPADPAPENPPSDGAARLDPDRTASAVGASRDAGRSVPPRDLTRQTPPDDTDRDRVRPVAHSGKSEPPSSGGVPWPWKELAACESSGDPRAVNPTGRYFGLYQFDLPTWASVGGTGYPHHASPLEQLQRAQRLQALRGWAPWPQCAARLGLS